MKCPLEKSIAAHCLSPEIVHLACWGKLAASVQVAPAAKKGRVGGTRPRAMTLKQMSKVRGQSRIALSSAVPSVLQRPSSLGSKVPPRLDVCRAACLPLISDGFFFFFVRLCVKKKKKKKSFGEQSGRGVAVLLNSCAQAKKLLPFKKQAVIQCQAASKLSAPIRLRVHALPSAIPGAYGPTVMKKAGRELAVRFA